MACSVIPLGVVVIGKRTDVQVGVVVVFLLDLVRYVRRGQRLLVRVVVCIR